MANPSRSIRWSSAAARGCEGSSISCASSPTATASVLVTGETGTGKELVANLIHHSSSRRHEAVRPRQLRHPFRNAHRVRALRPRAGRVHRGHQGSPGRFELAHGGTIFLDDIDDVPLSMQVKLLRVLQNRTVERLGGTRSISVDVRVITGSKRDLRQLVAEGTFREDLFYRLNVIPVQLPPLRERREDIPMLVDHFFEPLLPGAGQGSEADVTGGAAGVHALSLAGQRARARERLRAHRPDVHCDTVVAGCVPASILFHRTAGAASPAPASPPASIGPCRSTIASTRSRRT